VVLKDNICTRGTRTTCGSRILESWVPPYDATVVRRLREAGAVPVAKSNLDEFAMGSSTENSAFQVTRNPYDLARVPGGSSGGSAVAVTTGMAALGFGSETGGSVRQPASFTNLVGLKPTYGRLSRYGLVAFGSSLDQIGIFGRTVRDTALAFSVVAGPDEKDMTTLSGGYDFAAEFSDDPEAVRGLAVGVPRNILGQGIEPEVATRLAWAEEALGAAGVAVRDVTLAPPDAAVAAYYLVATAEASSNLARFDGVRYGYRDRAASDLLSLYTRTRGRGFGREVTRRILLGTYALSSGYYDAYYLRALRARTVLRRDLERALAGVDALLLPVSPTPAFRIGERVADPLSMYLSDILTIGANLCGVPALAVPAGFTPGGLPVGAQLVGGASAEAVLFRLGAALERAGGERRWPVAPAPAGERAA
jgi:aspartyl-tRNA(Asn)/glutamyl-tRNA(Gln) amidotransferase subunit A